MKKKGLSIGIGIVLFIIAGISYIWMRSDKGESPKANQEVLVELDRVEEDFDGIDNDSFVEQSQKERLGTQGSIGTKKSNLSQEIDALKDMAIEDGIKEKEEQETQDKEDIKEKEDISIYVYVCGAVSVPGVYMLPENSRVISAIECAGGFTKEAMSSFLNQARIVVDGEKIYVPTKEEVEQSNLTSEMIKTILQDEVAQELSSSTLSSSTLTSAEESRASNLIDLNKATKEQLMTLTGIGQAKAESILAYRTAHGSFQTKEQLMEIDGIKEAVYKKIMDKVCITKDE